MPRFRVLLTDYAWDDLDIEREILEAADAELVVAPAADIETLKSLAADVQAILTCWANVPEAVLAAAPQCRMVARLGIGLDNIDVPAATARGMFVTNVPDYCVDEVAEHTIALLLALARNIAWQHYETQQGRYQRGTGPALRRLKGQTLGIVGCGQIGTAVAERAAALGLNVLASRRSPNPPEIAGVRWCALDELWPACDFVTLHCPLTPETKHIINAQTLAQFRPGTFLINTSRGGLVDHVALAAALESSHLAGAGLDVQDPEPPDLSQAPYNDPRVIVTPHMAFASAESLVELRRRATSGIATMLQGGVPDNIVASPAK